MSAELAEALAATTDEQVEKGWHEDQVMRDQVVFFGWHEGYHLGVIGALRKALGYKGPAEKITEARAG